MDSENYWSNCPDDVPPTMWRNSPTPYAPLWFQEPPFIPQTAMHPFTNPCYPRPPEYPGLMNCLPEAYVENDINGRNNYNLYQPQFSKVNSREHKACHPFYGSETCSANVEPMAYIAHSNYQNMKMYPQTCMTTPYGKNNHLKTGLKKKDRPKWRKGKKTLQATMTPAGISSSALNINIIESHEKLQNDINSVLNCTSNVSSTQNKEANEYREISDQNPLTDKNTTSETENKPFHLHTSNFSNSFDKSDGLSCLYNEVTNCMLNAENLNNDEQITENDDKNTKIIPQSEAENGEEVNYFPQIKISNLSENSIAEISKDTLNNENTDTPKIYLECQENADEYVLKPIFDGKDENGQDIVIFRKELTNVNAAETIVHPENNEKLNSLIFPKEAKEHDTISNEQFSELQAERPKINQDESAVVFCSSIDDYALEEVVETSETCVNADTTEMAQSANEDETEIKEKQSNRKRKFTESTFSGDTMSSSKYEMQSTFNITSATSTELNTNYEYNHVNSEQDTQELQKQTSWKSRTGGLQRAYFKKFMTSLKLENKHIKDDALWDTLEIILNEIGGNMMQSMHEAFNSMIKIQNNSSTKKLKQITPSEAFKKKKPLHVKLMYKSKKSKQLSSSSKI